MVMFTRVSREEMAARHAAQRPKRAAVQTPKTLNIQQVLDLGNLIFFTFRGRPYGIPMLTYKQGLALAELQAGVFTFVGHMKSLDDLARYSTLLKRIPTALWARTRVVGRTRRWLRRVGLLANPFEQCAEAELGELLGFFLMRRMKSGVQYQPAAVRLFTPTL